MVNSQPGEAIQISFHGCWVSKRGTTGREHLDRLRWRRFIICCTLNKMTGVNQIFVENLPCDVDLQCRLT